MKRPKVAKWHVGPFLAFFQPLMTQTSLRGGQLCFRVVPLTVRNASDKFQLKPGFYLGTERQKVAKTAFWGHFWPFFGL